MFSQHIVTADVSATCVCVFRYSSNSETKLDTETCSGAFGCIIYVNELKIYSGAETGRRAEIKAVK